MILSNLILLPVFMQRWVNADVIFLKWYLNDHDENRSPVRSLTPPHRCSVSLVRSDPDERDFCFAPTPVAGSPLCFDKRRGMCSLSRFSKDSVEAGVGNHIIQVFCQHVDILSA